MKFTAPILSSIVAVVVGSSASAAEGQSDVDLKKAYGLLQRGDISSANRLLKPLVARESSNVIARRYFSYALLQQGKIDEACNQVRALAKLGANNSFDYWLYAQSYVHAGELVSGQFCLTRAFSTLHSPPLFSFLKGYSQSLEREVRAPRSVKMDGGNDQKEFPPTPFAGRAGA